MADHASLYVFVGPAQCTTEAWMRAVNRALDFRATGRRPRGETCGGRFCGVVQLVNAHLGPPRGGSYSRLFGGVVQNVNVRLRIQCPPSL